ncbi:MAG: AAA family ATPase, partial [bacterium]|nr:AAA family ATPase [bacterium]
MIYRFLGLELDEDAFEIRRNGSPVLTQRKAFDFVHFLLRNRDRVVTRDELIDALWGGASRSMSTIPQCAATVRRSLGEDMDPQAVVQTVRGRGYRFVAVIEEVDPAPSDFTAGSLGDAFERIGVSETRLVGRQEVLAALRGALQESLSGETRVVLLTGEPGIGKTRLVEELCREATNEGSMVLTGRCHEVDGAPAFWPWIQTIREWGRLNGEKPIPEELRKEVAFFASWRPEAGPQTADSAAGISEGPEARFQLFDVATRALRKFAEHSPLVLVLEDMHWADPASLGLLRFVAAQLHGERVLVLGTCREDELPYAPELSETLGELARESTFRRLSIKGLEREHVTELLLQIVGKDVPPALTESVVSMTEGNPFFVVELARILDAEESELEVELPVSISAAIGRRLGKLTAESRELLTLASVIGREFSMTLLSKVVGSEHGPILASLEGLVAARIIEPSSGAPDAYRFNHALIRETLYRGILAPSRARFHRLIATALERLYRESAIPPLAELAHHWYLAVETGGVEEAAEYCERAGLLAASRLAFEEAVSLLRRATELADLRPSSNDSVRCELLLQLGHAEWNAAEQSSSRATFARAAVLARQVGSARLFARAAIGYYGFEEGISADSTTLALLEE